MAACAGCGCSDHAGPKGGRSVRDSVSDGVHGVAADDDRRGPQPMKRSLGRALRRQRSRWVELTGYQRFRRMLFFGFAPLMLVGLPLIMGASSEDPAGPCPIDGVPTSESVPAMLESSGTVEKLDLTDQSTIALTIYADDENHGGQVDLREQMGELMRGLHQVAVCFPTVKTIRADLLAPGESRHDEYGNAVAGTEAAIVSLSITTDDLRAFKQNFDWESYPVYAANRYVRTVNVNFTDVWHRELEKEEEIGDFVNSL
jgi:hypothetical protein